MEEYKPSPLVKLLGAILPVVFQAYFLSVMLAVPYYNWKYANDNGFAKWMIFGEVIATGKGLVWPYFFFYADKETPKEPLPKSVASLLQSNEIFIQVVEILHKADKENPNETRTKEVGQQMKSKLDSGLVIVASVNIDELNQIYSGWGDHVRGEYIEGQKLWLLALQNSDGSKMEVAVDKIQLWNKWMGENEKAIKAVLKKKYGYVPPN